jgi:hypothetical protein
VNPYRTPSLGAALPTVAHTLTIDEVKAIHEDSLKRYPKTAAKSTRTEVHAELQLRNPPPYSDNPPHLPKEQGAFTKEERAEIQDFQRQQPTDAECIDFARNRAKQTHIVDAHHWVQMKHGMALWEETDRLLEMAGIEPGYAIAPDVSEEAPS